MRAGSTSATMPLPNFECENELTLREALGHHVGGEVVVGLALD